MSQCLCENCYISTSGVDYPFEDVAEARTWFDQAAISEPDRLKIAHRNAQKLFRL